MPKEILVINKAQIQNALKALAVGGAFMVPIAGFPLAALVAKKLYKDSVNFEKIKEVLSQLIKMKKVQQEQISFKDWLLYSEVGTMSSGITGGPGDIAVFKRPIISKMVRRKWPSRKFI